MSRRSISFENRRDKKDVQIYFEYKEKIKKCLQFSNKFLLECFFSLFVSFLVMNYDSYHLIEDCSENESLILSANLIINAILYFKFVIFVYLYLFEETEQFFRSKFFVFSIMSIEFVNSISNIAIAFLELIMENCFIKLLTHKIVYFNDRLIKLFIHRTNLHISSVLHIILAVLIMYNLIQLIKLTFNYLLFFRLENKAFTIIKTSFEV